MTARSYDRQTAKFLAVLVKHMPAMSLDVMQEWIDNPKELQDALRKALCPAIENNAANATRVKLGTQKKPSALAKALHSAGFRIGEYAAQLLKTITLCPTETEIELVNVSVGELGFENGATRAEIYVRAMELGLDIVPAEVGPQLRLQYPDQPYGAVLIGMEPILNSEGEPTLFGVAHDLSGRWLGTGGGDPDRFWISELRWVFSRRRKLGLVDS